MPDDIICYSCQKTIIEKEYVNVNEFFYHLDHFCCCVCSKINIYKITR